MTTVEFVSQSSMRSKASARVMVNFSTLLRGPRTEYSNSDGEVYVDGITKHKDRLAGRVAVYV